MKDRGVAVTVIPVVIVSIEYCRDCVLYVVMVKLSDVLVEIAFLTRFREKEICPPENSLSNPFNMSSC